MNQINHSSFFYVLNSRGYLFRYHLNYYFAKKSITVTPIGSLTSPEYPQLNYLSLRMNENLFKHFADSPVLPKMHIEVYHLTYQPVDHEKEHHYI